MQTVEAFTDGACRGNPGPGGWGVLLRYGRAGQPVAKHGGVVFDGYFDRAVVDDEQQERVLQGLLQRGLDG